VGSVALDSVDTPHGKRAHILGGSATHFSISARHFAKVRLVGVVGKDFPEEHIRLLQNLGIDTAGLHTADGLTFRWHGRYEGSMSSAQTLSVDLNVFGDFKPDIPIGYRDSKYVLLGNASPHAQRKVLEQIKDPEFVLLDTMNFWIETENKAVKKLLPLVHGLCINHEEAMMLADKPSIASAIRALLEGGVRVLVVKKAEHGALIATREFIFNVPAYPTEKVVDPTGAGDSFAGGLLGYLAKSGVNGKSLKRALIYGSVMGSLCVESFGTERLTKASSADIEERYQALLGMISI
jgi:sugar/nucleoside kinase (ribokinase family)